MGSLMELFHSKSMWCKKRGHYPPRRVYISICQELGTAGQETDSERVVKKRLTKFKGMKQSVVLFLLQCLYISGHSQMNNDTLLIRLFSEEKDSLFREVWQHPGQYRLQVLYTEINRDKKNRPSFTDHAFDLDPLRYFYPASVVKMPLAFLSLEKLHKMNLPGVNKYTSLLIDSAFTFQTPALQDATTASGLPSVAHYIKKAFLVSDNDAYNRLYQFVGQQDINRWLHAKGYRDCRITRQFMRITPEQNRYTNPFRFVDSNSNLLYSNPGSINKDSFDFSNRFLLGNAYYNWQDSLVNSPMDFTTHNYLPLKDLQLMLQSVMFPGSVAPSRRFDLAREDYDFLYRYLSQFPGETNYPKYDPSEYYDSYVKFFFNDPAHEGLPEGVRVFNKVGWAYGCLTDVSYVADFKNNIEFMLACTIYVNKDGVLNDNKYEYETVGQPFLYRLGQLIYNYELHRKRKYKPDLSGFRMEYEKRMDDGRPTVKGVDN